MIKIKPRQYSQLNFIEMKLKKQVLNKKEKRTLKFPKQEEIDRICIVADHLEAYLLLAYEENGDVEQTLEFMDDADLIVGLPPAKQRLAGYAALIYTHAVALESVEKKVYFDEHGFTVEVFITATPF